MPVFLLSEEVVFPPPQLALPDGLLALGGDLSQERLLAAYRNGIFPWYAEGQPILWWTPDPRLVLYPKEIKISKSLKKTIRKDRFTITMDQDFETVIRSCANVPRRNAQGTWIVQDMVDAYCFLHESGFAHSVETWIKGDLVGGLYGVSLGRCFFGESMFSIVSDASKVALVRLVRHLIDHQFRMIDCQVTTDHLVKMGAREVPRPVFLKELSEALMHPTIKGKWRFDRKPLYR